MNEKMFNIRIVHKHDTEVNWNKANSFIPENGELIVYDVDEKNLVPRIKFGDGINSVEKLPFITIQVDPTLSAEGDAADAQVVGKIINLIMEMIELKQNKVISSPDEPSDVADGTLWVDTDEENVETKKVYEQPFTPTNSKDGDWWIDISDLI